MLSRLTTILLVVFSCLTAVAPAAAQAIATTPSMPPDWDERVVELRTWVTEYSEWKAWTEKWRNRPEPGWVGFRDRREAPEPPEWLLKECSVLLEADGILGDACELLAEFKGDDLTRLAKKRAAAQVYREEPAKTVWWEHVHLDTFWPMPQWGTSIYGVIGVHATVTVAGRFQIFVAPGAILINLPNGPKREWQPAADYGVAYRLTDFRFPGTGQWASLHFNFAKAWILTGQPGLAKANIELAGFSFTFKKDPK